MYYVYILESNTKGRFYIGQTINIKERLHKHNSGYVKSTKPYIPWKLIYTESFNKRSESMKREKQIKSWKSRAKIEKLIYGPIV